MKRNITLALVALIAISAPAFAEVLPETAHFGGSLTLNLATGEQTDGSQTTRLAGDIYNNTNPQAAANFGFTSTDLTSTFGDRVAATGTGILNANDFTVFNSSSGGSTRVLQSVVATICHFNATTSASLGCYQTNPITFTGGLGAGFFSVVTITGLSSLNINLNTTDILITQQLSSPVFTGAGTPRLGIASLDPPTIGTSTNVMYINSSTVGPAGYYNIGNPPSNANPGYRINVTPEPTALAMLGLGLLGLIRRKTR